MQKATLSGDLKKITQFELSNLIRKSKLFAKIKLAPATRLVLESLVFHYPNIRVNIKTLEEETGNSRRSVDNALNELKTKGLIITIQTGRSSIFKLTQTFFDLLEIAHPACKKEPVRHAEIACPHNKQENKSDKKDNFIFKNLLELSKINTVSYYEQILNLSESEKERLAKIKLGRMNLTNFQSENLDKLILLSEYEINKINNLEPYYKQENIDIFYNARIKKIKEFEEKQQIQEHEPLKPVDSKQETLKMLSAGYKVYSKNKRQLTDFLSRNKNKMARFNISESDLCS